VKNRRQEITFKVVEDDEIDTRRTLQREVNEKMHKRWRWKVSLIRGVTTNAML